MSEYRVGCACVLRRQHKHQFCISRLKTRKSDNKTRDVQISCRSRDARWCGSGCTMAVLAHTSLASRATDACTDRPSLFRVHGPPTQSAEVSCSSRCLSSEWMRIVFLGAWMNDLMSLRVSSTPCRKPQSRQQLQVRRRQGLGAAYGAYCPQKLAAGPGHGRRRRGH